MSAEPASEPTTGPAPAGGALDLSRPFTRAAALGAGFDPRRRPKGFRRLFHGVYVSTAVEVTPLLRAEAVLLTVGEGAWASHATAARAWVSPSRRCRWST